MKFSTHVSTHQHWRLLGGGGGRAGLKQRQASHVWVSRDAVYGESCKGGPSAPFKFTDMLGGLQVVASCLDTLQPVILEDFDGPEDLKECLRASAAVPVVAGDPITHRCSLQP